MWILNRLYNYRYYIFCLSLSSVIVLWDIEYADKFDVNKALFIIMMIQLELSYVFLPSMQEPEKELTTREKKKLSLLKRIPWRKIVIGIFFVSTITPAALKITDQLLTKMMSEVRTEPEKPVEPVKPDNLDKDIGRTRWDIYQQNGDLKILNERLNTLNKQAEKYTESLALYNQSMQEYPEKVRQYKEYKAKNGFTKFIDYFTLIFGFVAMVSLQLMNGYSARKAASVGLVRKIGNVSEQEQDQKQDDIDQNIVDINYGPTGSPSKNLKLEIETTPIEHTPENHKNIKFSEKPPGWL